MGKRTSIHPYYRFHKDIIHRMIGRLSITDVYQINISDLISTGQLSMAHIF